MNYATWKLNFDEPEYGTGPEAAIEALGVAVEASWSDGEPQNGGVILGYLDQPVDELLLAPWELTNITQEEALDFCQALNENANVLPDGRIVAPVVI